MKTNLKRAVKWEVKEEGEKRFIQLFDENDNELKGENVYWEGDFDCRRNQLTSLEGCPKNVGGWFDCSYNQLKTLEGCPESVGGGFDCCNNQLTSLEGSPEVVNGSFGCFNNQLTSLEGSPKVVNGSFNCFSNQLTSLEGSPAYVGGSFRCHYNQLTSLKGSPKVIKGSFDCSYNQLTTLEGSPEVVNGFFDCGYNELTTLKGCPKLIAGRFYSDTKLDCSNIFAKINKTEKELFNRALELGYVLIDGILTKYISKQIIDGTIVYETSKISNNEIVYIVEKNDKFAHGETIKDALLDLDFKLSERNKDLYKSWNKDTEVSLDEMIVAYRVITGACKTGVKDFVGNNNLPSKLKVIDVIRLTNGHYGHEDFKEFFQG